MPDVRVGDVNLSLNLPQGKWDFLYPPAKGKIQAKVDYYYGKIPLEYKEPTFDVTEKKITMICQIDHDGYPLFSVYALRRNVAFLVGIISKKLWFIHAAGLVYKNKGIILIGQSGKGKSTLVSLFPNAQVLDDDLLFTDGTLMKRVSNIGTNSHGFLHDDFREHRIDFVIVLNNQKASISASLIEKQVMSHEITFDNRLPKPFFEHYKKRSPIKFSCPIFEIGTKSNPGKSKELIESVIKD